MGRLIGVTLLSALLLLGCSDQEPLTDNLEIGKPMPEIKLQRLDGGEPDALSDYRGKLVVLNLWATWCEPCRREMPNLQKLSQTLDKDKFAVIGMSQDKEDYLAREYLIDKKVDFAEYIDPGGAITMGKLGITLFPYTLLIAPDGRLIQRITGPRQWQRQEVVDLLERVYKGDYSGLR
jgi:peroxiredoxin